MAIYGTADGARMVKLQDKASPPYALRIFAKPIFTNGNLRLNAKPARRDGRGLTS